MKKILLMTMMVFATPATPATAQTHSLPPECRLLKEHKPSADVTYNAGVDVHGRAVVPADLNAAPMGIAGQTIVVPLSVDLAERLQGQSIAGLDMTGTIGFVEISPGGRVTYNGQDLTGPVHVLCGHKPQETAPLANGQTLPDAVEYAPVVQ